MLGRLTTEPVDHRGRLVTTYVPKEPPAGVVFAADGGWHVPRLAAALERSDSVQAVIDGVHGLPDDDGRMREHVRPSIDCRLTPRRTYLVAGMEEPFFLENAERWAEALRAGDADVVFEARVGEHGGDFWYDEFPHMVDWAFDH